MFHCEEGLAKDDDGASYQFDDGVISSSEQGLLRASDLHLTCIISFNL